MAVAATAVALWSSGGVRGADLYWDGNGAGTSGGAGTGVWAAGAQNWDTNDDGIGVFQFPAGFVQGPWVANSTAIFSAGSEDTLYDVFVQGTQDVAGVTFEDGEVTLKHGTDGQLNLSAGSTFVVPLPSNPARVETVIGGTGSLVKTGGGKLTLTNTNTYSGGTTISGGSIEMTGSGVTGGAIASNVAGPSVQFNNSTATFAGAISGSTAVSITSSAITPLTLSGSSSYTGGTTITGTAGVTTVVLTNPAALGSGPVLLDTATMRMDFTDYFMFADRTVTVGSFPSRIEVTTGNQVNFAGVFQGNVKPLTVAGGGTFYLGQLGNVVSAVGAITVTGNTSLGSASNPGGWGVSNTVTVNSGSSVQIFAGVTMPNPLVLSGNGTGGSGAVFNADSGGSGGFSGPVTLSGGASVGGNYNFSMSGTISGGSLNKLGASTVTLSGANTYIGSTTVTAGTLRVTSTGLNVSSGNGGLTVLTAGRYELAAGSANRVLRATTIAITGNGVVDLGDNKLITGSAIGSEAAGVYAGVQGLVQKAYNGGAWNTPGLTTSMPAALTGLTSIGVATGAQLRGLAPTATALFAGATITGASTIAMYTYAGDANLDGFISGDDYTAIDFNIAIPGADGWFNGDFNYDGIISGDDYSMIDFNIVAQGSAFPTAGGVGTTAVPEPASIVAVVATAIATCLRQRRRCRP